VEYLSTLCRYATGFALLSCPPGPHWAAYLREHSRKRDGRLPSGRARRALRQQGVSRCEFEHDIREQKPLRTSHIHMARFITTGRESTMRQGPSKGWEGGYRGSRLDWPQLLSTVWASTSYRNFEAGKEHCRGLCTYYIYTCGLRVAMAGGGCDSPPLTNRQQSRGRGGVAR